MSFESVLGKIGKDILKVFTLGEKAAQIAEPFVDIAFPAIGNLFNSTLAAVGSAQALGEAASASGQTNAQKLALVITAIKPTVTATLVNLGVPESAITNDVLTKYVNAFVALMNTLPAPTVVATTTTAPTSGPTAPTVVSVAPAST